MAGKVLVEALKFEEIKKSLIKFSEVSPIDQLFFLYNPNGSRFRILLVSNDKLIKCFYGELFDQKILKQTSKSKIINSIQKIIEDKKILVYGVKYAPLVDKWFLADETVSLTNFEEAIKNCISFKTLDGANILMDFAQQHLNYILRNKKTRPKIREKSKDYIIGRSLGCCEFENCADPLFINNEGIFGNYGTLAHIVAASTGGPRAKEGVSEDAITDPDNFLYLCEKHHRLIDKTDVETYTIERLRKMLNKRKKLTRILTEQLKYEETIPIIFEGDILEINTEISKREILDAVISNNMIFTEEPIRPIKLKDTRSEASSYRDYWNNFFIAKDSEIDGYKRLLRDKNDIKLSIFPLATMPFLFLMGYITGESRPVQLFHRNRTRGWIWSNDGQNENPFIINQLNNDATQVEVVILLSITAPIDESRIPNCLKKLPRIILECPKADIGQDVFNTQAELNKYKEKAQKIVNIAIDEYKTKKIHIITIAPAVAVFILGQKFQRRSSPPITMYQIDREKEAYPILNFNKNEVCLSWDSDKKLDI